jgi:hypothetical protein
MKQPETGDDRAGGAPGLGRLGCEAGTVLWVTFAVEGNEALAEQGQTFEGRVVDLAAGGPGLLEVEGGCQVLSPLGGVPRELADEDRCFGFGCENPTAGGQWR